MAIMWQAGMATQEFTREFERLTQDAGMGEEDGKVYLVLVLNQDTSSHLDAYIIMRDGNGMACLETIQDRLHHILYIQSWYT